VGPEDGSGIALHLSLSSVLSLEMGLLSLMQSPRASQNLGGKVHKDSL
jgi:hypothetical protein